MPTKIILNTTPPLDAYPIGFFITAEVTQQDPFIQVFIRYKVGVTDGGGQFVKLGDMNVAIRDANFLAFLMQTTIGGLPLAIELQNFALNFPVANGYINGTVA